VKIPVGSALHTDMFCGPPGAMTLFVILFWVEVSIMIRPQWHFHCNSVDSFLMCSSSDIGEATCLDLKFSYPIHI
jgi:hypothetical protein